MRILVLVLVLITAPFSIAASPPGDGTGGTAEKRIALTFDDAPRGPGPVYTGAERAVALIETLREAETGPVGFFVTTRHISKPGNRERIRSYADAGHLIANHTHSHEWLSRTDTDAYIADIDRAEELLLGLPNRRPWFRFPYLDEGTPLEKRDSVRAALEERMLKNGYVTVDNYDWYLESKWKQAATEDRRVDLDALRDVYVEMLMSAVEFYDEIAVSALGRSPVHVLLLHENDVAAHFVGDLVAALRADGWTIVSPDVAYADPIASRTPKTLMTRQGHVGALAVDGGLDPRKLTHLAIEEEQIDRMLAERKVFDRSSPTTSENVTRTCSLPCRRPTQ